MSFFAPIFPKSQGETKVLKLKNLRPQDYASYTCQVSVRNVCSIPDKSITFQLTNTTGKRGHEGSLQHSDPSPAQQPLLLQEDNTALCPGPAAPQPHLHGSWDYRLFTRKSCGQGCSSILAHMRFLAALHRATAFARPAMRSLKQTMCRC